MLLPLSLLARSYFDPLAVRMHFEEAADGTIVADQKQWDLGDVLNLLISIFDGTETLLN